MNKHELNELKLQNLEDERVRKIMPLVAEAQMLQGVILSDEIVYNSSINEFTKKNLLAALVNLSDRVVYMARQNDSETMSLLGKDENTYEGRDDFNKFVSNIVVGIRDAEACMEELGGDD